MKTDPSKGCANAEQRLIWAIIHDGLAHPLMALTGYCHWSLAFHDYTSHKAWPRCVAAPSSFVANPEDEGALQAVRDWFRAAGVAHVIQGSPTPNGYEYRVKSLRNRGA